MGFVWRGHSYGRIPQSHESTSFRIASITKPIVAALVLDAVGRGLLSLDDVVGDLLPGVIRPEPPITLRMLLDQTSGMFNAGDGRRRRRRHEQTHRSRLEGRGRRCARRLSTRRPSDRHRRPNLIIALAETNDRYFSPGEGYHYANVNYQLAAMVLERVTGQSIDELFEHTHRRAARARAHVAGPARPDFARGARLRRGDE